MSTRWAAATAARIVAGATVVAASVAAAPAATSGAATQGVPTCMGEPATIVADDGPTVGTDGPDVIVGSPGFDEIDPRGGRDLVCAGGSADDVTDNDAARDRIELGSGSDRFRTGPGAIARVDGGLPRGNVPVEGDLIRYDDQTGVTVDLSAHSDSHGNQLYGFDNVSGTARRDIITGTSASNWFFRSGGPDVMRGLEGDDNLFLVGPPNGWAVEARLIGGPGDDLLDVAAGGRTVMLGGAGDDALRGGSGPDRLNGGRGDDHLNAYRGDDSLRGGRGDDRLDADRGDDTISGGSGRDLWRNWNPAGVANGQHVTTVRIGAGTVRDRLVDEVFHDTLAGIEVHRGNRDVEHVFGSPRRDLVHANGTEGGYTDLVYGRGGDDRLTAPRHGRIDGGPGHDYCRAETVLHCET